MTPIQQAIAILEEDALTNRIERALEVLRGVPLDVPETQEVLTSRLNGEGERVAWIKAHLDFPHKNWCLIWPFAKSQTGYAIFGNPLRKVHRLMCEHRHGPAPTPQHHAAHSCDRGHDACVNPHHVDWKTPSENQFDRRRNGQERRKTKLTPEQAKEIRELKGLEHTTETAKRFGIRESNVRLIQSGKTWRKDKRDARVFTDEEVLAIRAVPQGAGVAKQLAAQYGVSLSTIGRVRCGASYAYVQAPELSLTRPDRNTNPAAPGASVPAQRPRE